MPNEAWENVPPGQLVWARVQATDKWKPAWMKCLHEGKAFVIMMKEQKRVRLSCTKLMIGMPSEDDRDTEGMSLEELQRSSPPAEVFPLCCQACIVNAGKAASTHFMDGVSCLTCNRTPIHSGCCVYGPSQDQCGLCCGIPGCQPEVLPSEISAPRPPPPYAESAHSSSAVAGPVSGGLQLELDNLHQDDHSVTCLLHSCSYHRM